MNKLLDNDFNEYSNSQYSSAIIPVAKKNSDVRIAVDYRELHKKPSQKGLLLQTKTIYLTDHMVLKFSAFWIIFIFPWKKK